MKLKGTYKGQTLTFLLSSSQRDSNLPIVLGSDGSEYVQLDLNKCGHMTALHALNGEYGFLSEDKKYTFEPVNINCIFIYDDLFNSSEWFEDYCDAVKAAGRTLFTDTVSLDV